MPPNDVDILSSIGFRELAHVALRATEGLFRGVDPTGKSVNIAVERAPLSGIRMLEAAFARGWMRLRGASHGDGPAVARVVIMTNWYSSRTAQRFRDFIEQCRLARNVTWVVTDGVAVRDSSDETQYAAPRAASRTPSKRHEARGAPSSGFSDQALVCAKTILLQSLPSRLRPRDLVMARRPKLIRTARDLIDASSVSSAQVYRFLAAFRRLGFLIDGERGYELRDPKRVMSAFAERLVGQRDQAVRAHLRSDRTDEWPSVPRLLPIRAKDPSLELRDGYRFAVTGHRALRSIGACRERRRAETVSEGLGQEVIGAPLMVYIDGSFTEMAELLDLDLSESAWWNVLIVRPRFPESVWRFVDGLGDPERLPHVDLVQCVIDLLLDPFKGREAVEDVARIVPELFNAKHSGKT